MVKKLLIPLMAMFLLVSAALAQNEPPSSSRVVIYKNATGEAQEGISFYSTEMLGGNPVKGAPYSATAITESTQVLSDGNRIVQKSSSFVARDGQGRVRREESKGRVGQLQVDTPKLWFITDPVSGNEYVLLPEKQTGRQVKIISNGVERKAIAMYELNREVGPVTIERKAASSGDLKEEDLGTQTIEGVSCHGTRVTRTIPAGVIGNERPLVVTSESWTSPDLHVLVMRKRSDPRMGETTYQLTNIVRGEPDPSLFQVPANFKIEQSTGIRVPLPAKKESKD